MRVDELALEGNAVRSDMLSCAVRLPMLSELHIRGGNITSEMAATLPTAKRLVGLELQDVHLDEQAWRSIYQLNLIWLIVDSCNTVLNDEGPADGQMGRLMSLRLSGPTIDKAALRRAGRLSSLRQISVRKGNVSGAGSAVPQ